MEYYYLGINLFSILGPLALSFDQKVRYVSKWRYTFFSILATYVIFVPWDLFFHRLGVWWFNDKYIIGKNIFGLPIEENLFFIAIPFACIFILECIKVHLPHWINTMERFANWKILSAFNVLTICLLLAHYPKLYSITVYTLALILINLLAWKHKKYFASCLVALLFIFIPFILINGALTGGFTNEPVVGYNNDFISSWRIWTIPLEDFYYNILMMISLFYFYFAAQHLFQKKK